MDYTEQDYIYFDWLEDLRKSGIVNMYGARPYLAETFDLDKQTSSKILSNWMRDYKELSELRGW